MAKGKKEANADIKINLGSGKDRRDGYINVDKAQDLADIVHDLEKFPWPFDDNSAVEIIAQDIIEHLRSGLIPFMNEAWRVLKADGRIYLRFPGPNHPQLWADPDHVRPYTEESLQYFDPDTRWGNLYGDSYTDKRWKIVTAETDANGNVTAVMAPIK